MPYIGYAQFQHATLALFRTSFVIPQSSGYIPARVIRALLAKAAQPSAFVPLFQACVFD